MTDNELKKRLKNAYETIPSEKEKVFIKKYEKRRMQIFDVLKLEIKYMGLKSCFTGPFLCILLFLATKNGQPQFMWIMSSVIPTLVLLTVTAIGSSRRCGMEELEAACRFSLKFIRMIRMMIFGSISLVIIVAVSHFLKVQLHISILETLSFVGFPYLINVWGCLLISRKWHSKENMYGCIGVTVMSCILPFIIDTMKLKFIIPGYVACVVLLVVFVGTVKEMFMYVKESEDLSWSLC